MPPAGVLIGAAASAGLGAALGTTVLGLGVAASAAVLFGAQVALGTLSSLLAPKVALPNLAPLEVQATGVTQTVRQAITARRHLYGEARISGPIVFLESSADNQYLYLVIALCEGPVTAISTVYLHDAPIFGDQIDSAGQVIAGKFAGKVWVRKVLGTADQAADSWLLSERPNSWTANHRLRGTAYLVVRLTADRDLFPTGMPNISAWVQGSALYDPRDGQIRWTTNAALVLRAYLADTRLGLGAAAAEFDDTFSNAAANVCDEFVTTLAVDQEVTSVDATNHYLVMAGERLATQTGDRVQLTTDGTLPGGLAINTDYYVIPRQEVSPVQMQLATSYTNALAGTFITFSDGGDGARHVVGKTAEPRYTANGVITSDRRPADVIGDMLTAMGGRAINAGGTWRILAAAWAASAVTLDENVLRGPIEIQIRHSRRERFNAVKGIYVSPEQGGQPTDYPAVTSSGFEAQDGGLRISRDLDLPMTGRPQMAQRLAKIELLRHRQEITARLPCTLAALQVQTGDTVALTNARYGWTAKPFEIVNWKLAIDRGGGDDAPFFGVDLEVRETASAVFDFDAALDETLVDPAPNTNLPNPFTVLAPGAPQITEEIYVARAAGGVKSKASIVWAASDDAFVINYQLEYREKGAATWVVLPPSPALTAEILDVVPSIYEFRVKAINTLGVSSAFSAIVETELFGLATPPVDITGLTIVTIGGLAVLRWTQHADLDVREGGQIVFRHTPDMSTPTWGASTSIGEAVPGASTIALLPLKGGTYLVKAVDSSGVFSAGAAVAKTAQATALNYANVSSLQEDPGFTGSKTNTVVATGKLKLDVDGGGGVLASGTYDFAGNLDYTTAKRVRLTSHIRAVVTNVLDLIDSRTALIDTWDSMDGDQSGAADAQVWTRHTPDDPAASPVWSNWERIDSGEFDDRAFEFQARLTTLDPAFNILVSELRLNADEVV